MGVSLQGCLCPRVSVQGGGGSVQEGCLCPDGSLPRSVFVQRVSVQGCLCPGVSLSSDVSVQAGLYPGVSLQGRPPPSMITCGHYASYWNAFLFILMQFWVACPIWEILDPPLKVIWLTSHARPKFTVFKMYCLDLL